MVSAILRNPDAFPLTTTRTDDRIRVGLGPLKREFSQWCQSHGLSASGALRMAIAQRLEKQLLNAAQTDVAAHHAFSDETGEQGARTGKGHVLAGEIEQAHEATRLRLRLKPSELDALTVLAQQRRVSPHRLATQILRAFLLNAAVFSQQETVDMGAVNLSLMRIGTNLNQVTKQLNAQAIGHSRPGDGAYAGFESLQLDIRRCLVQLDNHVKECAHALALSKERWRIELKD